MAAREQVRPVRLVELRSTTAAALAPVLNEEKARWRALLHWDFSPSADLVSRYVSMQALDGFALLDESDVVGYAYWVAEDHKGLIGDLYVRDAWRSPVNENMLLGAAISQLRRSPWIRRVEAQLMQLGARGSQVAPGGLRPHVYQRHFMLATAASLDQKRVLDVSPELRLEHWGPRWLEDCSELISAVYKGHVDSEINDQYHSPRGARRFLQNIVQYPGCGYFSHTSSFVALDQQGRVRGLSLASMVAPRVGHIAQLCVAHQFQGGGAGYELLRRSMAALADQGAEEFSLTVTASNARAIRLYEHFGFRAIYHFDALVWDRLWP
jgi:ribosomal protein S18 acetylase RimI-like enzyme